MVGRKKIFLIKLDKSKGAQIDIIFSVIMLKLELFIIMYYIKAYGMALFTKVYYIDVHCYFNNIS